MQIYLAKPGGQREGPFTLDQINRDLAAKKYRDTDYWAWHEGLPEWLPLHSLPGVSAKAGAAARTAFESKPSPETTVTQTQPPAPEVKSEPATPAAKPELQSPAAIAAPSMASGKPFSALEHIFVLTTGDGPSVFKSEVSTAMLQETAGETLDKIRSKAPVYVIGRADAGALEAIRTGSIPSSAWRALSAIRPAVVQQAQEGVYHLCVRTFPAESSGLVALFLLYNKQKL